MAETRTIQYVVEIDTAQGKAQLREMVEGGGGASGPGGGGGGGAGGKPRFDPGDEADKTMELVREALGF